MSNIADTVNKLHTLRRFKDGESVWGVEELSKKILQADRSYKCPVYVQRTPPCQGSCPSGHDVRGWLSGIRFRKDGVSKSFPSNHGPGVSCAV
jgi:hypothetical protein